MILVIRSLEKQRGINKQVRIVKKRAGSPALFVCRLRRANKKPA